MLPTNTSLGVLFGLIALASAAPAGPIVWNYQIRTDWAPARILVEETGVTDTEVVHPGLVRRPTLAPPPWGLPDVATYLPKSFEWTNRYQLEVRFTDVATWTHNYDEFGWAIRRVWVKSPDGLGWELRDTTEYLYPGPDGVGYNYAGGNRYEVRLNEAGDVTLSMTPNVPNPYDQPEPGTLILAGLGLAGAGLLRFRRRLIG